jgi:predicted P-loop ATPase
MCLIEAELTPEETFSVLMNNPNAHGVAMDHRKQDEEKASVWMWKHQVLPAVAKQKAKGAEAFEDVRQAPEQAKPLPSFERDKQGAILATLDNLTKALSCEEMVGCQIRHDDFRAEVVLSRDGGESWEPLTDAYCVRLRLDLERRGFKAIGRELMRDALDLVCTENQIDTAIYWLEKVIPDWDGVKRIETFHPTYLGTEDSPYTRAISRYLWTALAGRVLSPGIKADMALVWVGRQGIRKTSACKALVPSEPRSTSTSAGNQTTAERCGDLWLLNWLN